MPARCDVAFHVPLPESSCTRRGRDHPPTRSCLRAPALGLSDPHRPLALRGPARESRAGPQGSIASRAWPCLALAQGRRFRCLTVLDVGPRVCPRIAVDVSLPGLRVTRELDEIGAAYGFPEVVVTDNGPEFTSAAMFAWARRHSIRLHFIDPGKPMQNPFIFCSMRVAGVFLVTRLGSEAMGQFTDEFGLSRRPDRTTHPSVPSFTISLAGTSRRNSHAPGRWRRERSLASRAAARYVLRRKGARSRPSRGSQRSRGRGFR